MEVVGCFIGDDDFLGCDVGDYFGDDWFFGVEGFVYWLFCLVWFFVSFIVGG